MNNAQNKWVHTKELLFPTVKFKRFLTPCINSEVQRLKSLKMVYKYVNQLQNELIKLRMDRCYSIKNLIHECRLQRKSRRKRVLFNFF